MSGADGLVHSDAGFDLRTLKSQVNPNTCPMVRITCKYNLPGITEFVSVPESLPCSLSQPFLNISDMS